MANNVFALNAAPAPAPSVSELARTLGISRRTAARRLKNGELGAQPIRQQIQQVPTGRPPGRAHARQGMPTPARRVAAPMGAGTPKPTPAPAPMRADAHARPPVDLMQLRRDIQDWTKLHLEVERSRTARGARRARRARREPYNPRMVFFILSVGFYALLAAAAVC